MPERRFPPHHFTSSRASPITEFVGIDSFSLQFPLFKRFEDESATNRQRLLDLHDDVQAERAELGARPPEQLPQD